MVEIAEYELYSWELGNCPGCAAVVVREVAYVDRRPVFYWPCQECGFTHHGEECPPLE